jgi:uncharacterized repeat protein (TIGR02543 family)
MGEDLRQITLQVLAVDPSTLDYALERITVSYDTVAPPLVLDNLGAYPLRLIEGGYSAAITGHAEAGASILVYQKESEYADDYSAFIAGAAAGEDGCFSITLRFDTKPDIDEYYCVVAVDAAGNASETMSVSFKDAAVTISFDPNDPNAACSISTVGIAYGGSIGTLPEAYGSDGSLFDGWYYINAEGGEVDVSASTTFTEDTRLYARWAGSVVVSVYESDNLVAEFTVKAGLPVGALPAPRVAQEGRMFLGWYTAQAGGSPVTEETVINSNTSLHARWTAYTTVTFDSVQGTCEVSSIKLPSGGSGQIAEYPEPVAKGYTFLGWYSVDGEGVETDVSASTVFTEDTTLYARWQRNMNTTALQIAQEGCKEDEELSDPEITLPDLPPNEAWVGTTTITYVGTGNTNYMSAVKPAAPGHYKVIAQRNTFETAYVASAEFTIAENILDLLEISKTETTATASYTLVKGKGVLVSVYDAQGRFLGIWAADPAQGSFTITLPEDAAEAKAFLVNSRFAPILTRTSD